MSLSRPAYKSQSEVEKGAKMCGKFRGPKALGPYGPIGGMLSS
jgi:hypothetical protein